MDVLLANPRGFCAGVDRAIEIVERALETFGAPIADGTPGEGAANGRQTSPLAIGSDHDAGATLDASGDAEAPGDPPAEDRRPVRGAAESD